MEVCFLMVEKAPFLGLLRSLHFGRILLIDFSAYIESKCQRIFRTQLQFGLENLRLNGSEYPGAKVTLLPGVEFNYPRINNNNNNIILDKQG